MGVFAVLVAFVSALYLFQALVFGAKMVVLFSWRWRHWHHIHIHCLGGVQVEKPPRHGGGGGVVWLQRELAQIIWEGS